MNRIEEIKERHKTEYVQPFVDEQELLGQWRSDIRYLIEEVERLQNVNVHKSYSGKEQGYFVHMGSEEVYFNRDEYKARMFMAELKARIKLIKS